MQPYTHFFSGIDKPYIPLIQPIQPYTYICIYIFNNIIILVACWVPLHSPNLTRIIILLNLTYTFGAGGITFLVVVRLRFGFPPSPLFTLLVVTA